jgi:hypothetical protein
MGVYEPVSCCIYRRLKTPLKDNVVPCVRVVPADTHSTSMHYGQVKDGQHRGLWATL